MAVGVGKCPQLSSLISYHKRQIDRMEPDRLAPKTHTQAGSTPAVSARDRLPQGVMQTVAPFFQMCPATDCLAGDHRALGGAGPHCAEQYQTEDAQYDQTIFFSSHNYLAFAIHCLR